MLTIPVNLASHLDTLETTIASALKITREDGNVFGFTSHDVDDVIPAGSPTGVTYYANPGLTLSSIVIASGCAVGTLQLTTIHDETTFLTVDILSGLWRNATFELFRYNYEAISDGIIPLLSGTIGEVEIKQNQVVAELRDYRQYLQHPVGDVSQKNCRYRLGDSRCAFDLNQSPGNWIVSGTITDVTSNSVFRDSSRGEVGDWFGEGSITFTSGPNAGITRKVKAYDGIGSPSAGNGTFTLAISLLHNVDVGHTYTATVGCRKRFEEDCIAKFANQLNFGGEPHRKGPNDVTKAPPQAV